MALVNGQQSASRISHSGEKRNHCLYRILKPRLLSCIQSTYGLGYPVWCCCFWGWCSHVVNFALPRHRVGSLVNKYASQFSHTDKIISRKLYNFSCSFIKWYPPYYIKRQFICKKEQEWFRCKGRLFVIRISFNAHDSQHSYKRSLGICCSYHIDSELSYVVTPSRQFGSKQRAQPENRALLGYYPASSGNSSPPFRDSLLDRLTWHVGKGLPLLAA